MRPQFRFGHFTFAPDEGELRALTATQRLQPQVAALLEVFLNAPGRLFTHEELVDLLWPDVYVNPEALTQVMSRLRRALSETRSQPRHLETLHKRGYRFLGEVTLVLPTSPSPSPTRPSPTFAPAAPRDMESDLTTPNRAFIARRFPTLTIAAHPDLTRVGESVRLTPLTLGDDVHLSRLQPGFRRHRNAPPRPLEDAALSRMPLTFKRGPMLADGPSMHIELPDTTSLRVDGVNHTGPVELDAARIAAGVTLELADQVTLVLHQSAEPKAPSDTFGLLGESYATTALRHEIKHISRQPVHIVVTGEALALPTIASALARLNDLTEPLPRLHPIDSIDPIGHSEAIVPSDRTNPERPPPPLLTLHLNSGQLEPHLSNLTSLLTRPATPTRIVLFVADPNAADEAHIASLPAYVLAVSPLAQRRADVAPLLLDTITRLHGTAPWSDTDTEPWLPAPLMARIVRHDFPGGLAELETIARHLATLGATGPIAALPLHLESRLPF